MVLYTRLSDTVQQEDNSSNNQEREAPEDCRPHSTIEHNQQDDSRDNGSLIVFFSFVVFHAEIVPSIPLTDLSL